MKTHLSIFLTVAMITMLFTGCGGSSSAAPASSGGDNSETADTTITTELSESDAVSTEDADAGASVKDDEPLQDESAALTDQAPDYTQDEVVIADTDKYKLTVTGYDPEYSQEGIEGFLIKMAVENKAEKEYTYMITDCVVNHVLTYGITPDNLNEIVVPSGESAEMKYVIPSSNLSYINISSVDALLLTLQIASSEFMQAANEGDMIKVETLRDSNFDTASYKFSPTGANYDEVSPAIELTDNNYEILVDNDMLTFGFQKNEDGTLLHDNYLFAGLKVQSDELEKTRITITELSIDGKEINEVDAQGNIVDVPAMRYIIGYPNVLIPSYIILDDLTINAYDISGGSTLQFTLTVYDGDGGDVLYNETISCALK